MRTYAGFVCVRALVCTDVRARMRRACMYVHAQTHAHTCTQRTKRALALSRPAGTKWRWSAGKVRVDGWVFLCVRVSTLFIVGVRGRSLLVQKKKPPHPPHLPPLIRHTHSHPHTHTHTHTHRGPGQGDAVGVGEKEEGAGEEGPKAEEEGPPQRPI